MNDLESKPFLRVNDSKDIKEIKTHIIHTERHIKQLETGLSNLARLHAQLKRDFEQYKRVKQY